MRKVPLAVRFLSKFIIFALKSPFAGHQVNYLRYPKMFSGLIGGRLLGFLEDILRFGGNLAIKVSPLSSSPY